MPILILPKITFTFILEKARVYDPFQIPKYILILITIVLLPKSTHLTTVCFD